jgi:hypothetical protein
VSVQLQTDSNRLDFLVRNERFTSYLPTATVPGFTALLAPGGRTVTRALGEHGLSLLVAHGNVNGVAFGNNGLPLSVEEEESDTRAAVGRIVSEQMTARRGSQAAGFRQVCAWLSPSDTVLLHETRLARLFPGPGESRILDLTLYFHAPEDTVVTLGRTQRPFLALGVAAPLWTGGGQARNSRDDYGLEALHGQPADWCACVGVVQGETVGFALLDHPENPGHPPAWIATADGLLSPSPFLRQAFEIAPHQTLPWRYRILVHRGYVDKGWADARLSDFVKDTREGSRQ